MKRTALIISILLSISTISCSSSFNHETTYQDFISKKSPIDNSKVEFDEGFLDSLDYYFNDESPYKTGVNYEEYYSSKYDECIRLYEDRTFLYYSPIGAKSSNYCIKDNFFTVNFHTGGDFSNYDNFLFYIENNQIVNLDKLSVSISGFSFNSRKFIRREKEQPIVSQYLYTYKDDITLSFYLSVGGYFSQDGFLETYNLRDYKDYITHFISYENTSKTIALFEIVDFSHFLDDINYFYELNKKYKFEHFLYEMYGSLLKKQINIAYYSLTEENALENYQYYGTIGKYINSKHEDLEDIDRLFASKQELNDLIELVSDYEYGVNALNKLAEETTDEMFIDYNLLLTRTVFNNTYAVRPFDGLYYANNELYVVLEPAGSGYQAITEACYVFFIPKNLTYQNITIYW